MKGISAASFAATLVAAVAASPAAILAPRDCNRNNCLRQLAGATQAPAFCATYTAAPHTAITGLPTYVSNCDASPSKISSACSCLPASTTSSRPSSATASSTRSTSATGTASSTTSQAPPAPTGFSIVSSVQGEHKTAAVTETLELVLPEASYPPITATAMRIGALDVPAQPLDVIRGGLEKKVLAGADNGDGTYLLAVLQYTTNSSLINMEDFMTHISSVTCTSTSSIAIRFADAAAYGVAAADWTVGAGIVTSGSDLCGDDQGERSHYKITGIQKAAGSSTITLAVTPVTIKDIATHFEVNFSSLGVGEVSQMLPVVGNQVSAHWPAIQSHFSAGPQRAVKRASDGGSATWEFGPDMFVNFFGFLGGALPITDENALIQCRDCGVWGRGRVSGGYSIDVDFWNARFWVAMDLDRLEANMDLDISYSSRTQWLKKFRLGRAAMSPINIAGLFVGPAVELHAGVELDVYSYMGLYDLGFNLQMEPSGWMLDTSHGASKYGWGLDAQPLTPRVLLKDSNFTIEAWIEEKIMLEASLTIDWAPGTSSHFGWDAYIDIQAPTIEAKFLQALEGDQCYNAGDYADYGIDLAIGLDISAGLEGDFIGDANWPLYQTASPVWAGCGVSFPAE